MSLCFGASGSISWPEVFADMWGDAVRSLWAAAVCVPAQSGPACSDSVALAVTQWLLQCPVTMPCCMEHLRIWKQNYTAACWVTFKHYLHPEVLMLWVTDVVFAGMPPKEGRRIEFSLLQKQENPEALTFCKWCFPLCGHTRYHAWIQGILEIRNHENHEPVGNSKFAACPNIYQPFSPTPKSHSLLE